MCVGREKGRLGKIRTCRTEKQLFPPFWVDGCSQNHIKDSRSRYLEMKKSLEGNRVSASMANVHISLWGFFFFNLPNTADEGKEFDNPFLDGKTASANANPPKTPSVDVQRS